jgi:hypothetical protein
MIRGPVSMTASEAASIRKWGGGQLVTWAARAAIAAAAGPARVAWHRFAALSGSLRPCQTPAPRGSTGLAVFTRPRPALRLLRRLQLPSSGADDDPAVSARLHQGLPVTDP